jgi:hypothetical protein
MGTRVAGSLKPFQSKALELAARWQSMENGNILACTEGELKELEGWRGGLGELCSALLSHTLLCRQ